MTIEVDTHFALPPTITNMIESTWYNPLIGILEREATQLCRNNSESIRIPQISAAVNWMRWRQQEVYDNGSTAIDREIWGSMGNEST